MLQQKLHCYIHIIIFVYHKDGWTPLHVAAQNSHTQVVEVLTKLEANVHATSEVRLMIHLYSRVKSQLLLQNGWTPLHCASLYDHPKVAEKLIKAGQNIDVFDHVR